MKNNKTIVKNIILITLIIFIGLIINCNIVDAKTKEKNLVNIYFFHSKDCSHCKSETKLLDRLENKYSNIKIYRYEIHNEQNNKNLNQVQNLYDIKTKGVPLTIIGATYYNGYNEEKSSIEFIKTIEYYSRYGYHDEVGELLKIKELPTYKINDNNTSLEKFKESYGNYQLIGNLYTNDIDISLSAMILGVLSQLNIIKIISILLIIVLLIKVKDKKNKILALICYIGISFILTTTHIFSNEIYTLLIKSLILILFIIGLLKYKKNKKIKYLYGNMLIGIIFLLNYLENYFFHNYNLIFKDLIELYNLSGLGKITHYINYLFTIGIINIMIIILSYYIKKLVQKFGLIK